MPAHPQMQFCGSDFGMTILQFPMIHEYLYLARSCYYEYRDKSRKIFWDKCIASISNIPKRYESAYKLCRLLHKNDTFLSFPTFREAFLRQIRDISNKVLSWDTHERYAASKNGIHFPTSIKASMAAVNDVSLSQSPW
jgi:hypothetical protein